VGSDCCWQKGLGKCYYLVAGEVEVIRINFLLVALMMLLVAIATESQTSTSPVPRLPSIFDH
jgi:hypothetical protein